MLSFTYHPSACSWSRNVRPFNSLGSQRTSFKIASATGIMKYEEVAASIFFTLKVAMIGARAAGERSQIVSPYVVGVVETRV